MKTKNNNNKRWKSLTACVLAVALVVVVGLSVGLALGGEEIPVATTGVTFTMPMNNATVVKDYSDTELQYNSNLNRWEIHLSVDLTSDDLSVFSIADGTVASVETNSLEGSIVTIEHADGFVSVYSSLSDDVLVSVGDTVALGEQIGEASTNAANETSLGEHLHLTMLLNDEEVDPNNYLDLQNK